MKKWNWDFLGAVLWGFLIGLVLVLFVRTSYESFGNEICGALPIDNIPTGASADLIWKCESTVRRLLANGDPPMLLLLWALASFAIWTLSKKINKDS
jgi:hypothetical protein